jgi:hypothetical protein
MFKEMLPGCRLVGQVGALSIMQNIQEMLNIIQASLFLGAGVVQFFTQSSSPAHCIP